MKEIITKQPWIEIEKLMENGSSEAMHALAEIFVHSANKKLRRAALKALLTLAADDHREAQETLCRLVIDYDEPVAKEIVLATEYAPCDPQQRALFYFLTEQWEQYETLDFDQNLLKTIYPHIPSETRKRLMACARRAGRLDFVSVVAGAPQIKPLREMTEEEWHTTLAVLGKKKAWSEMWRLSRVAPPIWSLGLLQQLRETVWRPKSESERVLFTELLDLAERCKKQHVDILKESVPCITALPHPDGVSCVAMSPNGQLLATGSFDAAVRLWSLPGGILLNTLRDHSKWVNCVAFSPDGQLLLSGGFGWQRDEPVRIWSLPEGIVLHRLQGPPHEVTCLTIHPDGEILAFAGRRGSTSIRLWSLKKGEDVENLEGHSDDITGIGFSPDGQFLVSGSRDQTLRVWHMREDMTCQILEGHTDNVECIAISPNSRLVASGSRDNTLRLWSLPQGTLLNVFQAHSNWIKSLAFSPDGSLLASGGHDHRIRLWSLPDGKLRQTLEGHNGSVLGLAFSPDGHLLASCSYDHTVRLWNVWKLHIHRLLAGLPDTKDLNFLEHVLQHTSLTVSERGWLEFLQVLLRWQQQFDIELEASPQRLPIGEFDIEIDGIF